MPTITIQVGQCGNQLGQTFWDICDAQKLLGPSYNEDYEYFRFSSTDKKVARCILVDTEPKVVNTLCNHDRSGIFPKNRCFLGQSGRGNNWAFGYQQMAGLGGQKSRSDNTCWRTTPFVEDPSKQEFHILEHVMEGIRQEVEECGAAPNFLMLHALGGGSGSGLGSRLLEQVREAYPLSYIATGSVLPRQAGDAPMQALNSVMALSFVQSYADAAILFDNQEWVEMAGKGTSTGGMAMSDVNTLISQTLVGLLWPLAPTEIQGGVGRVRDLVLSTGADPGMKMLEARSAVLGAGLASTTPVGILWPDALKSLANKFPKYDVRSSNAPSSTLNALLVARGFTQLPCSTPQMTLPTGSAPANLVAPFVRGACGASQPGQQPIPIELRASARALNWHGRASSSSSSTVAAAAESAGASGSGRNVKGGALPSVSAVCNRSTTAGKLDGVVESARRMCSVGAYIHWYEKYGCSRDAVLHAADMVDDVAQYYRYLHRNR